MTSIPSGNVTDTRDPAWRRRVSRAYTTVSILLFVGTVSAPAPLPAQHSSVLGHDGRFVQLDHRAAGVARLAGICAGAHALSHLQVVAKEPVLAEIARKSPERPQVWIDLGCLRALLFASGSPTWEGLLMPSGSSWADGAIAAVFKGFREDPANLNGARLLAALSVAVTPARRPAAAEDGIRPEMDETAEPTDAMRQWAFAVRRAVRAGVTDPEVLRACVSLNLDVGAPAVAENCDMRALQLGVDSTWHLLRLTWLEILRGQTRAAVGLFEHALDAAHDSASRAEIGWHLEDPCPPRLGPCSTAGLVAARLSAMDRTHWLTASDSVRMAWFEHQVELADSTSTHPNGGKHDVLPPPTARLKIRSVASQGAMTRQLVRHFLGVSYAAGTFRTCITLYPIYGCSATLSVGGAAQMTVVAQLDHVWDPMTGEPIDLVPYALDASNLAVNADSQPLASAPIYLLFRQWGPAAMRDTVISFTPALPDSSQRRAAIRGYLVFPTAPTLTAWTMMATQGELPHSAIVQDEKPPLDPPELAVSDLVIGAASQGLTWHTPSTAVVLAPLDTVSRNALVSLYYQVKSSVARGATTTTITLYPAGANWRTSKPAFQESTVASCAAGLNQTHQDVNLAAIAAGNYWFEVRVTDRAQHATSSRAVMMYVR